MGITNRVTRIASLGILPACGAPVGGGCFSLWVTVAEVWYSVCLAWSIFRTGKVKGDKPGKGEHESKVRIVDCSHGLCCSDFEMGLRYHRRGPRG